MDKYHKKKLKIAFVYLLILVVIVGGIYLLIKAKLPSCSDGIQNQGEEGIDCGGPCAPCAWQLQKDLEVIFTEAVKTQDNYSDLIAKIRNPNKEFGAGSFSYVFDLYDSSGNLIISKEGASYILPQETKYIIEQKVLVQSRIYNIEFRVTDIPWQELVDYEEPELLIRNLDFKRLDNTSRLSGTLENRSNYDFDRIDICSVLFDVGSNIKGVGKTEVRTVLSKESRYFEINWFFLIDAQIENMDVVAKTNVFSDENFMRRYGESRGKFQEY